MKFISVENISKSYGERVLFENISFTINEGKKIAFVAKNGTGKTSILNIIAGLDISDTGEITMSKGTKLGFLPQEPVLDDALTIEQTLFQSASPLLKVVEQYEWALRHPDDDETYQKAFEQMEQHNAWDFERQFKQILSRLKIKDIEQPVGTLSGGQRKRVALAHVLVDSPDFLLLDEPTNHLDMEMIEWLEEFLEKEKITLFMVTHDRYFLERVCNEILEMDEGELHKYQGNYSYFLEKKEERIQQQEAAVEKARNHFRRELEWMRRQPKARGTKAKSRIADFYKVKEEASYKRDTRTTELEINMERLGAKIVELHNVSKAFEKTILMERFTYSFKRGERVGIVGKNGTGKTTFLNMITGNLEVDAGKIVVGETVKFGYYTQKGIHIQPEQKVIEVIREVADYIPLTKGKKISAEQLLERFLFSRKKQYDFVEKLSGGEKKRLYLCRVLMQNPNFLILDEPTNDLDVITLNVLENFLLDFPGCLLVVSHDRYFMDKIVDHLFVFRGDGVIEDFPGNYTQFRQYEDTLQKKRQLTSSKPKESNSISKERPKTKLSYKENREFEQLEQEIELLEDEKSKIEQAFQNPSENAEDIEKLSLQHKKVLQELEEKTERWLELSILKESFEK